MRRCPRDWARVLSLSGELGADGDRNAITKIGQGEPEAFTAAIMVMYMEVRTECAGLVGRKGKHL